MSKGHYKDPCRRPRLKVLSSALRNKLTEINPTTGLTSAEEIVIALVKEEKKGNVFAARELKEWRQGATCQGS
jgi:hypothetical protein